MRYRCEPLERRTMLNAGDFVDSFAVNQPIAIRDNAVNASNGKIAVVGRGTSGQYLNKGMVVCFNANGTLDTTFGVNGIVTLDFADLHNEVEASAVAFDSSGRLVVSGEGTRSTGGIFVARLTATGSSDASFSSNGWDIPSGPNLARSTNELAIDSNGRIVIGGRVSVAEGGEVKTDMYAARYNSNGTLDTTFSGDGWVNVSFGEFEDVTGLAIDANGTAATNTHFGQIALVGSKYSATNVLATEFAIVRLNTNGALDNTFSGDGRVLMPFQSGYGSNLANAVLIQPGGKVVVAGSVGVNTAVPDRNVGVLRLNADGSLDSSFGTSGRTEINPGALDEATTMILSRTGELLIGGRTGDLTTGSALVCCVTPNGALDLIFGGDGSATVPGVAGMTGMSIAPNGTIVVSNGKISGRIEDRAFVTLSLASFDPNASETSGNAATLLFTRDPTTSSPVTLYFQLSGTAAFSGAGADYAIPGAAINTQTGLASTTIPSNEVALVLNVVPVDDSAIEGPESIGVTLVNANGTDYDFNPAFASSLTIADNDFPAPTTAPDLATVSDSGISSTDNITRDNTPRFSGDAGTAAAGRVVRVQVDGVLYSGPITVASNGTWLATTAAAALADGDHTVTWTIADTASTSQSAASPALSFKIDTVAPQVLSRAFRFETDHSIAMQFSEVVFGETTDDLTVVQTLKDRNVTIPSNTFVVANSRNVVSWTYRGNLGGAIGVLPDGNYSASLSPSAVTDAAGNTHGSVPVTSFFVLAADANRDRKVDFNDLVVLAQNYNLTGRTFSQGNFDYSTNGKVDFNDLVLLAQRYGNTAASLVSLVLPPVVTPPVATKSVVKKK